MQTVINQQVLHMVYELPVDGTKVPIHGDVVEDHTFSCL